MKIATSLLIVFFSHFVFAADCHENRGALDIGSGTTKGLVAEVDTCEKKIVKVLFENHIAIAFNEALEKSGNQTLPESAVEAAIPLMQSLVNRMQAFKPTSIRAVATSVFRIAHNGTEASAKLTRALHLPVTVISQEQEAHLGYLSALSQKEVSSKENLIVWDIGGGSMQMYSMTGRKSHLFEGNLASVTFKNKILEVLQFKDVKSASSPNPLGRSREAAIQLAKNHAYLNVPAYFKQAAKKSRWIGVGGVLSASIQDQVNSKGHGFTQEELEKTLEKSSTLTDDQIDSDYRTTQVSNLALVLGYMKALGIKKIETAKVSLGQGVLTQGLR
ncbi:MAG TPA: hypothetical protein VF412_04105 [Bdellovibrio sp.]|uniref:Ppx/GppA phosphatase family protein n=1 Tax=Bdellovibrio sp. TaxID=28201 RepID=UPI002F248CCF